MSGEWNKRNPERMRQYRLNYNERVKKEVLSHYGRDGKMQCAWHDGCEITDPDMLSIDHIDNSGGQHRKAGQQGGRNLYVKLKNDGFPPGYQTLCHNHQWKKEIARKRSLLP